MILLTDEYLGEQLDLLAETDPLWLRDVAWSLYKECKRLREALAEIGGCPNPDSVEDCHNIMSDIARMVLA